MTDFLSAEQSLYFTLCRRITFLNLSTTGIDGRCVMCFGRTGCSTTAVTAGTTTKQDDNITRIRSQTLYGTSRSCTQNRTDLHTFCHIVRMIYFLDKTGCQTNLVTVGTVTRCCGTDNLLLRKFSFQSVFYGNGRISRTCDTHCLVNISTSGQRITDGSTQTGCGTTKRLNLSRMVVCLIFEVYQPLFRLAIHLQRNNNTS